MKNKYNVACVISGGKDGIFAYYKVLQHGHVVKALINLYSQSNRVSFHRYEKALVQQQASAMGLPLIQKKITPQHENQEQFESQLKDILLKAKENYSLDGIVVGYILQGDYQDILLKKICSEIGLKLILPNHGRKSERVAKEIVKSGIKAMITTVNEEYLSRDWLSKFVDTSFLAFVKSKNNIDFCGDKGEYHTFVVDAPFFKKRVTVSVGKKMEITKTSQKNGVLVEVHAKLLPK